MEKSTSFKNSFFWLLLAFTLIITTIGINPSSTNAATSLSINLNNNQTFYILPGTTTITYDVKILSGGTLGDVSCSSSNLNVATIDDMGKMILKDAGSTRITVKSGNKTISRMIHVLVRSDWAKVVSIKNAQKLSIKNQICTLKLINQMDFPIKMTYFYNTYTESGSLLHANITSSPVYLPANGSLSYQVMMSEDVKYISIDHATYEYSQYNYPKINTKKISIKQSTETDHSNKTVKYSVATIKNNNKSTVIIPYHLYLYDQNKQLISVEYKYLSLAGKQKLTLREVYQTKDPLADRFTAKVTYKFETPIPFF